MREMAKRPEKDRRDLFRATAQRMGVHEAIVEKDFWVCWVLDHLFQESPWKNALAFKGGTSLSKAYGAVERFSEDIDLILDWRLIGSSDKEAWGERTATKMDAFSKEVNRRTAKFLAEELAPALAKALPEKAGAAVEVVVRDQEVLIAYPKSFSLGAIQPQIRLEIGPLAVWIPNEPREIRPYAAEQFPALFAQPLTTARTIAVERTFWEKATILHQEANRGPEKTLPLRLSRHYYDLYRMSLLPVRERAVSNLEMLEDVIRFKMKFYRCPWAKYEEASSGRLRLQPAPDHLAALRRDYQAMGAMLFGEVPSFETILAELAVLEEDINSKRHS